MLPKFKESKATQAACELLRRAGGEMNYMKLIKLLYLADRESLIRRGRPVTFDQFVSMDYGPVPSKTLDLINYGNLRETSSGYWEKHISAPSEYRVEIQNDCPRDDLSESERGVLDRIFEEYGDLDEWDLVDVVHELPEWEDPDGSAIPIDYGEILRLGGREDDEVEAILDELKASAKADRLFA